MSKETLNRQTETESKSIANQQNTLSEKSTGTSLPPPVLSFSSAPLQKKEKTIDMELEQEQKVQTNPEFSSKIVQRVSDPARPDGVTVDITGSYEAVNPGGNNRITFQLNQAGRYFSGWYQRRRYNSSSGQSISNMAISGEFMSQAGTSVTYQYTLGEAQGTLTFDSRTNIATLSREEWSHSFRRVSTSPAMSDAAIADVPAEHRDLVRASERAPLDSTEEQLIISSCTIITSEIRDYFNIGGFFASGSSTQRMAAAMRLDHRIETLFHNFASQQRPLVLRLVMERLINNAFERESITRSTWDWLQIIVNQQVGNTQNIQRNLNMRADGSATSDTARQHSYHWEFAVGGFSGEVIAGVGLYVGQFTIRKNGEGAWTQNYFVVFGVINAGVSAGVNIAIAGNGDLQAPSNWSRGNFVGAYSVIGSVSGGITPGFGASYAPDGTSRIIFYGDGAFTPIDGDAGGLNGHIGLAAGVDVISMNQGYLHMSRENALADYSRRHRAIHSSVSTSAASSVHFGVDSPHLTEDGRQAIRVMCAEHRALLNSSREGAIEIKGYTSTTGTDAHNLSLSNDRALNVKQAIIDIMGSSLIIQPGHISARGYGEVPAREAGVADEVEDIAWRKVEIRVNGTLVLVLR